MIRWTGLAPWEFEFRFPGSLTFTFLEDCGAGVGGALLLLRDRRFHITGVPHL